jgi:hypothetical protein
LKVVIKDGVSRHGVFMEGKFLQRAFSTFFLLTLSLVVIETPTHAQSSSGLPPPPNLATDMHAVPNGYEIEFGPISIQTEDEFSSAETRNEVVISIF